MKNNRSIDIISKLIKRFKELRQAQKMSHDELASRAGLTRAAVSHIESGKRKPSLITSLKLAEALGCSLSDLLSDAEKHTK